MRPRDCLLDPLGPKTARSRVALLGPDDGLMLPGDLVEIIEQPSGLLAYLRPTRGHLDARRRPEGGDGAFRSVTLEALADEDGNEVPVVVKRRGLGEASLLGHRAEAAVFHHSRTLSPDGASLAVDLNRELERAGHPGRVPTYVMDWKRCGPDGQPTQVGLAITVVPGVPLHHLVTRDHPHGLPPQAASALIRSLSSFVAIAHRTGIRLGDINAGNILVVGDVSDPASLYVNVVDLEMADVLGSTRQQDREAWIGLVDPRYRWRVTDSTLTDQVCAAERMPTWIQQGWPMGFETDLAYLHLMVRLMTVGPVAHGPAGLPPELPGATRWALSVVDQTSDLADRREHGVPEVADADSYGSIVADLVECSTLPPLEHIRRVEQVLARCSKQLLDETIRWAERHPDPAVKMTSARLHLEHRRSDRAARDAVRTLSALWVTMSKTHSMDGTDRAFREVARASGLADAERGLDLIQAVVPYLATADKELTAGIGRIWPDAVAGADPVIDVVIDNRRHSFLSGPWLDQFVARAPNVPQRDVRPGLWSIRLDDDLDLSFTIEVDDDGHVRRASRGTSLQASGTSRVTKERLADHLDGTAFVLRDSAGPQDQALVVVAAVAPGPRVLHRFTSDWPEPPTVEGRARLGTTAWIDLLVQHSRRQPSHPDSQAGAWSIVVVDAPQLSFTFEVGADGRISSAQPGVHAPDDRRANVRRERLRHVLQTRPALQEPSALSVLCAAAAPTAPFTDTSSPRLAFLGPDWLAEALCLTSRVLAVPDVAVLVTPIEDPASSFELQVAGGRLERLGRSSHGGIGVEVTAPDLWDALVLGRAPTAPHPQLLDVLAAIGGPALAAFTTGSDHLGVPPGTIELTEIADRRARLDRVGLPVDELIDAWLDPGGPAPFGALDQPLAEAEREVDRLLRDSAAQITTLMDQVASSARTLGQRRP